MALDKLVSAGCRLFFGIAFLLLGATVTERLANYAGYTILRGTYGAGRLLEFSAISLLFVIALLIRQMRDQLKKT